MCIRDNKEVNVIKYLLFVLIIVVLALSFVPCNKIVEHPGLWSSVDMLGKIHYEGYAPVFCLIVTIIELMLLIVSNRWWSIVVRFVLNFMKISTPMLRFYTMDKLSEILTDVGSTDVYIGWSVYLIIGIGIVIGAVKIIDIVYTAKKNVVQASE